MTRACPRADPSHLGDGPSEPYGAYLVEEELQHLVRVDPSHW
jgi:hypothetical protein